MPARGEDRSLVVAQLVGALHMGGAEHLAVQIANARALAGDRSHLYVVGTPGPLSDKISSDVSVHYFHHRVVPPSDPWRCLGSVRTGYRLLAERIAADGIEVVQSHLPGANFWGLLLSMRGRCAVVPTVHNNREFAYGDDDDPLRARIRRWAYKRMLRSCPAVVAVSEKVRDSLLAELGAGSRGRERVTVVPNGVAEPEPLAAGERERIRERFGCGPDGFLALAAGRHDDQKNFGTLIDAVGLLRDEGVDVRLVLAGEGPLLDDHKRRADASGLGDQILFPGNLDDLPRVMQSVDCFVMSSLWEGLPLVLLEAMACGAPVAGTRIAGIDEVIDDGANGVLAEPGDARSLATAVGRLVADPGLRVSCREKALALVRSEYSFKRVSRELGDLYRRVAGAGAAS